MKPRTVGAVALGAAALFWACASVAATQAAPAAAPAAGASAAAAPAAGASGTDMAHAKTTFETLCSACHEPALATQSRYNRKGWEGVIDRMYGFGLSATDAQAKEIINYLATNYPAAE